VAVVRTLLHLEQLDNDLGRLEAEARDARRRVAGNPALKAAEAHLQDLRRQEEAAATRQRAVERELDDLDARIKRDGARMYSGQIVDTRELGSLEREIEHYRVQQRDLEDRCLSLMDTVEGLQREIESAKHAVDELRGRWEGEKGSLSGEADRLEREIVHLRTEREQIVAGLEPRELDLYTRLRSSSGHAVSHVSSGVCEWCHVTIPPKDVQHARSGTLAQCTNCARILYVA
jgi:predicted  nucleic acid-binding Zn-ribbon protein